MPEGLSSSPNVSKWQTSLNRINVKSSVLRINRINHAYIYVYVYAFVYVYVYVYMFIRNICYIICQLVPQDRCCVMYCAFAHVDIDGPGGNIIVT